MIIKTKLMRGNSVLNTSSEKVMNHPTEPVMNSKFNFKTKVVKGKAAEPVDTLFGVIAPNESTLVINTSVTGKTKDKLIPTKESKKDKKKQEEEDMAAKPFNPRNGEKGRFDATNAEMALFDDINDKDVENRTDLENEFMSLYNNNSNEEEGNVPLPDISVVEDLIDRINEERELDKFNQTIKSSKFEDAAPIESEADADYDVKSSFIEEEDVKKNIRDQY